MRGFLPSRVGRVCALVVSSLVLAAPAVAADYVALGDSFSSGVGTGSYTLSSSCYRGTYAYPWLVHLQRPTLSFDFAACSGAKTTDVLASQMQAVTSGTTLVTVTAGGNDIGFSSLITQCTLGSCSAALDATRASLPTVLAPRLFELYAAIKAKAAAARIVVLGYPRMFGSAGCVGSFGITSTERAKANQLAEAVDAVSKAQAQAAGVSYVSALGPFATHAVCSSSPWLNGLNLGNSTESYHPNRNGHKLGYAPLVG